MFLVIKKKWLILGLCLVLLACLAPVCALAVADKTEEVEVPVFMYHSVAKGASEYCVTPKAFEADLKFLKENGYQSVFCRELADYVENGAALPLKPVVITFDDGFYNNLSTALPLLEKYQMKATVSVIGKLSDAFSETEDKTESYAHLSWEDVKSLSASPYIEIGNHTYNLHSQGARNGCAKKRGEDAASYEALLLSDLGKTNEKILKAAQTPCTTFAYPFGFVTPASLPVLEDMGFTVTLGCDEKINKLRRGDSKCLQNMARFNRDGRLSTAEFMKCLK